MHHHILDTYDNFIMYINSFKSPENGFRSPCENPCMINDKNKVA